MKTTDSRRDSSFEELLKQQRSETPVPMEVEARLRARLHAFRDQLATAEPGAANEPLVPQPPTFARREPASIPWKGIAIAAVLALVAAALVVAMGS